MALIPESFSVYQSVLMCQCCKCYYWLFVVYQSVLMCQCCRCYYWLFVCMYQSVVNYIGLFWSARLYPIIDVSGVWFSGNKQKRWCQAGSTLQKVSLVALLVFSLFLHISCNVYCIGKVYYTSCYKYYSFS